MKILFYLGHPAHFHLFKNIIHTLDSRGHEISVLIKKKDILEDLLKRSGIKYHNILPEGRKDTKSGIAFGMIKRDWRLFRFCLKIKPDLMIGTSAEIGHIGSFLRIPSMNVNEDDADAVPYYSKISYPFSTFIVSPSCCNNGKWEFKSVKYGGYHELAYLHPDHFKPSEEIVNRYFSHTRPYFLIRFANLNAHHDKGISGITDELALEIINILKPYGDVYITSERELEHEFEPYRLQIDPLDIHHIMAFAKIYIGDSQTMAAEAGVLGVPFIRFNDFVGRIGYLNELENNYQLGFGIRTDESKKLFSTIQNLLNTPNLKQVWQIRREIMLKDKINTANFMTDLIENYPESVTLKRNDKR